MGIQISPVNVDRVFEFGVPQAPILVYPVATRAARPAQGKLVGFGFRQVEAQHR